MRGGMYLLLIVGQHVSSTGFVKPNHWASEDSALRTPAAYIPIAHKAIACREITVTLLERESQQWQFDYIFWSDAVQ